MIQTLILENFSLFNFMAKIQASRTRCSLKKICKVSISDYFKDEIEKNAENIISAQIFGIFEK